MAEVDDLDYSDALLRGILRKVRTIAIVGASERQERPSYQVFAFLISRGYRVIGVNPGLEGRTILGARFVGRLKDLREPIDMVDIFRNSEAAGAVVDEALALEPLPLAIWMQLGVRDNAAAARAKARGVEVIMNRCPKIEYGRAGDPSRLTSKSL
jgi:predicted CoA-binding protein